MEDQPHQLTWAAVTRKLRDPFSTRGPLTAQVLRVVILVLLIGGLLLLAGLTLAGTLIGLAVTAPLFVLFSPVLVPAALTIGLVVTGFLTSVALVLTALFFFTRVNYLRKRIGEPHTISGGDHADATACNSLTSSERTAFWPSSPVHTIKESVIVNEQQQQKKNERTIPGRQRENDEASVSSNSVKGNDYYVFLSFRGPDTRKSFADHLYRKLKDVGLRFHPNFVFRDNEELPYGEDLGANLISAITHSKISIPVISKNYAASEWCLRELICIMECKESGGQIVLPVLYQVETKDVKYLKGSVKEAFESRRYWSDEAVKQQGTEALRKAAECRVYESENFAGGQEAELVDELVATVMRKQQDDFRPYLHENLVGNDDDVAEIMRLVDTAHPNTRIIGIYGISGIGKTTLATIIYTKLFDKFGCRSFIRDVGETIKKNGIEHVQSRLISDILNIPKYQVPDSDIGIKMIQTNCTQKKVLILLDDVSHQDHVNKLIENGRFMPGSRIIITCRDEATLKSEYHKYKCKELNITNSSLLFNIHAFGGKPPPTELASLSSEIVATTAGLPLALIVFGSLLKRTKDPKVWEEYRDKWRKAPEREVMDKLKISYNTLEESTKQIFLDIACFFIGTDYRIATYLWSYLDLYPRSGLQKMVDLSLIKYDDNNELRMHDQLRDLGRAIARTADKKPCSRLWDKEATTILQSKEGNENIKALRLDENGSRQFLHVSVMDFTGDFEKSFSELRWLKWERCPDSLTVTDVHLEKLLILDLSSSNINENWEGWSSIKISGLKVLNLSGCIDLNRTPDLSAFKSLERLILENCENLEEIDPSIGNVKNLVSLNLRHCGSLKELPEQLGKLIKLEELLLDETDIQEIPTFIGSLEKLTTLSAVCCCLLTRVPSSISSLVSLSTLNLSTCKKLQELPDSFKALGQLERLILARCYALKQIPSSIGKLKMLEELDLSSTKIRELPESIEKLDKLKILRISHSQIERLPSSIGKLQSLREFDASGCHRLRGQILVDEVGLSSLMTLRLGQAKISHLPENFRDLSALDHVDLLYCTELQSLPEPPFSLSSLQLTCRSDKLPSLAHLGHLKKLTVHSCMSLQSVPELPSCIQKLRVCKCPGLERLSNLPNLKSLLELELLQCYGLKELDGLEALESLRKLDVSMSTELSNLNDFEDLESLRYSDMQCNDGEADYLREIPGLGQLKSLEVLNISARKKIRQLDLSKSEHLRQLIVNNCQSLVKIQFHDKIESLERFDRDGCQPQITRLFGT